MAKKLTAGDKSLLAVIVLAMANDEAPFHFATPAEVKNLLDNDMVEVNNEITDGDKVAVRATEKGMAEAPAPSNNEGNTNTVTDAATATATPTPSPFAIIDGAVLPEGRAPRSSTVYPFETMNVGQSFFVPATADKPNPAKSLASTVSSANKRFAEVVTGEDGKPVTETYVNKGVTKTRNKTSPTKLFTVKPVKSGVAYGAFTAPADGALVLRAK